MNTPNPLVFMLATLAKWLDHRHPNGDAQEFIDTCNAAIAALTRPTAMSHPPASMETTMTETDTALAACPYVVGQIFLADPNFTADEDGNPLWEAEIQVRGGYSEIARTWGTTEEEARSQAEAIAAALSRPSPPAKGM